MTNAEILKFLQDQAQKQDSLADANALRDAVILIKALSVDSDTLKRRAEAAERDLHSVINGVDDGCLLCAHYHPCAGKDCPQYISGVGMIGQDGKRYPTLKWSCDDFEYGTCPAMENTPCNGCDFENHWQWRGPCKENGGEHE